MSGDIIISGVTIRPCAGLERYQYLKGGKVIAESGLVNGYPVLKYRGREVVLDGIEGPLPVRRLHVMRQAIGYLLTTA